MMTDKTPLSWCGASVYLWMTMHAVMMASGM